MKKIFTLAISFMVPSVIFAQRIVPNCDVCGFQDLVDLGTNIMVTLIEVGALVGAIVFAYAGWLYLTSGGNSSAISKAKGIFINVIIGFIFMLSAWLIVNLILRSLGFDVQGLDFLNNIMS